MKSLFGIIVFFSLLSSAISVLGVDASQLISQSTYQCIKNKGYKFAIIRAFRSYGAVDGKAT